jgi:hypothetical protein
MACNHHRGASADPRKLAKAAMAYENSAVCRLGYLLDHAGPAPQTKILESFARKAKSMKLLDPSVKPLTESLAELYEKDAKWMLVINEPVEIDCRWHEAKTEILSFEPDKLIACFEYYLSLEGKPIVSIRRSPVHRRCWTIRITSSGVNELPDNLSCGYQ